MFILEMTNQKGEKQSMKGKHERGGVFAAWTRDKLKQHDESGVGSHCSSSRAMKARRFDSHSLLAHQQAGHVSGRRAGDEWECLDGLPRVALPGRAHILRCRDISLVEETDDDLLLRHCFDQTDADEERSARTAALRWMCSVICSMLSTNSADISSMGAIVRSACISPREPPRPARTSARPTRRV